MLLCYCDIWYRCRRRSLSRRPRQSFLFHFPLGLFFVPHGLSRIRVTRLSCLLLWTVSAAMSHFVTMVTWREVAVVSARCCWGPRFWCRCRRRCRCRAPTFLSFFNICRACRLPGSCGHLVGDCPPQRFPPPSASDLPYHHITKISFKTVLHDTWCRGEPS